MSKLSRYPDQNNPFEGVSRRTKVLFAASLGFAALTGLTASSEQPVERNPYGVMSGTPESSNDSSDLEYVLAGLAGVTMVGTGVSLILEKKVDMPEQPPEILRRD